MKNAVRHCLGNPSITLDLTHTRDAAVTVFSGSGSFRLVSDRLRQIGVQSPSLDLPRYRTNWSQGRIRLNYI